jgi:hypothetical protein
MTKIELRKVRIEQWKGVSAAAKALGVTPTHVNRHLNSDPGDPGYSIKLQTRIDNLGIKIIRR